MSNDQLVDRLKALLEQHGLWAKKHLGQNFLVDEKVFDGILAAADLNSSDDVVEVGPGTGFLTERLLDAVNHVTAVEKDRDMVAILEERFRNMESLDVVESDILKFKIENLKLNDYKVVANIPYYITSPLLKHFLQSDRRPDLMVLLVQKEVAEKVCGIGGKSLITIETQLFGKPEIVMTVPPTAFHPAPKVESAVLKIEVYDEPLVPADQLKAFLRLVKFGFSQKRKKLSNTLSAGLHMKPAELRPILESVNIDPDDRAERLEIEDWKRLLTKL